MTTPIPKKISLEEKVNLGVEFQEILVSSIQLQPDDSGTWIIEVSMNIVTPERGGVESVSISERHFLNARITVLLEEIADFLGIPENLVYTDLTLKQTEETVTGIAFSKLITALNLSI